MKKEAASLCGKAHVLLQSISLETMNGEISMENLQKISKEETCQHLHKFFEYSDLELPSWSRFETAMKRRVAELDLINERQQKLFFIVTYCKDIAPGKCY